ncbi:MAG: DUF4358 domain-containing protein [Acutalibacteraceae bacterium]
MRRFAEILCVIFLIVFIVFVSGGKSYSDKSAAEVAEAVVSAVDTDGLAQVKKNKITEDFGIHFDGVDSYVYYAADSVMDVRELMLIKLKQGVRPDDIMELIRKRAEQKQVLFKGYAPEQSALLESYVLKYKDGFVFYAVGHDSAQALSAFHSSL